MHTFAETVNKKTPPQKYSRTPKSRPDLAEGARRGKVAMAGLGPVMIFRQLLSPGRQ
jgi:hypothetical protein